MNRVIEWQGGIGKYEKYTFRVEYNPKIDRWYSGVEIFPFRAIHIIGQYYTSQQNAKDSCEDFIECKKKEKTMSNKYSLIGIDGNAYSIMGYIQNALKREGLHNKIDEYIEAATSGDYNNLLTVSVKYIKLANEKAKEKELLPCPFCGGKAIITESKFGLNVIYCELCEARITALYIGDVIKAWNKRVNVAKPYECCKKSCKDENATKTER